MSTAQVNNVFTSLEEVLCDAKRSLEIIRKLLDAERKTKMFIEAMRNGENVVAAEYGHELATANLPTKEEISESVEAIKTLQRDLEIVIDYCDETLPVCIECSRYTCVCGH